jgi:acyl carrier protein
MDVKEKTKAVISDILGISLVEITDDASTENIEQWDSLKHITLIVAVEETFGIEFDEQIIPELTSLQAITRALQEKAESK